MVSNIHLPRFFFSTLLATCATPIVLKYSDINFINLPIHNYLIQHLITYSFLLGLAIPIHIYLNIKKTFNIYVLLYVLIFYLFVFGGVINNYISTFFPSFERLFLLLCILITAFPLLLVFHILSTSQNNSFLITSTAKLFFLISLIIAISLNHKELFLLGYVVLLFILFMLVFGFLTNILYKQNGNLLLSVLVNTVTLSWTFAIALPMYIIKM